MQSPLRVGKPPGWRKEMPGTGWGPLAARRPPQSLQSGAHGCSLSWRDCDRTRSWSKLFPGLSEETELCWTKLRATGSWSGDTSLSGQEGAQMGAIGLLLPARASLTLISALGSYCGTATSHFAHLLAPLLPARNTHAPGRGPGTPVLWGASPGGPDRAERT